VRERSSVWHDSFICVTWLISVCDRTHAHTHTNTHTHTHTHKHKHTHTQTHINTHTHTHARTHASTHTRTHARTHMRIPVPFVFEMLVEMVQIVQEIWRKFNQYLRICTGKKNPYINICTDASEDGQDWRGHLETGQQMSNVCAVPVVLLKLKSRKVVL